MIGTTVMSVRYNSPQGELLMAEQELSKVEGEKLLTLSQAAQELGVTSRALLQAIKRGRLPAQRLGSQWVVTMADLIDYKNGRHAGGRPVNA